MNKNNLQRELIKKIQNSNDERSYRELFKQYEPLIISMAFKIKRTYKNKKIGIIISGGNVDLSTLPFS
ncbi:MAG: hypothetical protein HRS50_02325 [Mycoplasmataceae bacterium]|nr:hypothetical protein [Mycoplasmataceae bacterium]